MSMNPAFASSSSSSSVSFDQDFWSERSQLRCSFADVQDLESGIQSYQVAVVDADGQAISESIDVGASPFAQVSGLNLTDGSAVKCRVRAVNRVGMSTEFESDGVTVDLSPPVIVSPGGTPRVIDHENAVFSASSGAGRVDSAGASGNSKAVRVTTSSAPGKTLF